MGSFMACRAEGDQILGCVIAEMAPPLYVVDLETLHPPAQLTTPAISFQNFPAKLAIRFRLKLQAGSLRADPCQRLT
jgi:hypothetical protein